MATDVKVDKGDDPRQGDNERPIPPNAFQAPCLFCTGNHATSQCSTNTLTREEKRARLKGLCYACLKPGHSARRCRFRLKCEHCQGLHPSVLHEERNENETGQAQVEETHVKERNLATATSHNYAIATVPVRVWANGNSAIIRALLDPASTATFVSREAARLLDASPENTVLSLSTMSGQDMPTSVGILQGLRVAHVEGNADFTVNVAYVVDELPVSEPPLPEDLLSRWPHLAGVPWDWENADAPLAMLIGLNVHEAIATKRSVMSPTGKGPYATCSALGWSLQGPVTESSSIPCGREQVNWTRTEDLQRRVDRLFYADFKDVFDFSSKGLSRQDRAWIEKADRSAVRLDDGRYEVELPFRAGGAAQLSNNFGQANQRMQALRRRFAADANFHRDYSAFVQKMIDQGHVEQVPDVGQSVQGKVVNYVPHHGVYHPQKKKIRVVFNCASRYKGVSLNDCLISGPDLTNSIIAVLLRFRQFPVAFMGDIEAMFYQVLVPEHQRDTLRFLWWPQGDVNQDMVKLRLKVHLFGATSSPSVANFALKRAAEQAEQEGVVTKETKEAVVKNFYVDDCLVSKRNEKEAVATAHELVKACQFGGFRLTKFVSTSVQLLRSFDQSELAKELALVDFSDDKVDPLGSLQERALGVAWNVDKDKFVFRVMQGETHRGTTTKRTVLSQLSKVYDPLGIAAPVVIVARILFRQLNSKVNKADWDTPLKEEEQARWDRWTSQLSDLGQVALPRCFTSDATEEIAERNDEYQLHTFCDASTEAYAAVSFLRSNRETHGRPNHHEVAFALGKARVAPPKTVTIPRLELTAAKLAAELANSIGSALEVSITKRVFWSDSTTVLKYLKNESKRFHVFVSNRVNSILHLSESHEWRYVPTELNPADEGSRGLGAAQLHQSKWISGPEFLQKSEENWPDENVDTDSLSQDDPEVRRERTLTTQAPESEQNEQFEDRFPVCVVNYYSTAFRVRRGVAIWTHFCQWLKGRRNYSMGLVSLKELRDAESLVLRTLQDQEWREDVRRLQHGSQLTRRSPLYRLRPQLVNGLVRSQGRAGLSVPVVPGGRYAQLLVQEAHERQLHLGRQSTAAEVLRYYHVVGLNKIVRKVLHACPKCQLHRAPMGRTVMAPLPPFRIDSSHAFEMTGIDYFGPFTVKPMSPDEQPHKAYGVIFSCAVTRAVHLEVATDLSSAGFINALRRFTARRGGAKQILSDNGTNFKGAAKELQEELKKQQQQQGTLANGIRNLNLEWQFNPPAASHFGGFWERLIRIVRQMLDTHARSLSCLNLDAFHTLLCECEAILNNRPLTTVGTTDVEKDLEALTPNHLLLARAPREEEIAPPTPFARTASSLRNRWKCIQHTATQFWRRWQKEYRILLQEQTKWFVKRKNLNPGNVVMLVDPIKPRSYWKLGRVVRAHEGRDGVVRVVDVKTSAGVVQRPITKLCLLETASGMGQ